jgi:thioredoxin reductase (NADPH)
MNTRYYDIVICGAGPAGLTAAIYARRAGKSVMILEKSTFGGQITHSPKVENYPGFAEISGNELADIFMDQAINCGAELDVDEVLDIIDTGARKIVVTASETEYSAGAVIIAAGAKHRQLNLKREDELTGHGVSYCVLCDGAFFQGKDVAVIGGGNSALQDAVQLSEICNKVTVVQNLGFLTGENSLIETLKTRKNVEFIFNNVVSGLEGDTDLTAITLQDTTTGNQMRLPVHGIFVAIGQEPENTPFAGVTRIDDRGYIISGEDCLTGTQGIYVAGDCRTKQVRQVTTATGDGASAALAACRYLDSIK